jgi:hypothetical protein
MGPGPPGWGLGLRLTTSSRKNSIVEKLHKMKAGCLTRKRPRVMIIRGWRRRALDRDRWKEVLTAARAQNGL